MRYNRSFFFLSYEGLRLQQPRVSTGNFYTPETRANVAPIYRPIVEALPIADGPLVDPRCDNVTVPCRVSVTSSFSNPTRFDAYSARLDHTARRGVSSFARFAHTPSTERNETFANVEQDRRDTTLVTAGVSAAIGNRVLNDLRVGWGRSEGEVTVLMADVLGAVPPALSAMFRAGDGPGNYLASVGLPGTSSVAMGRRALNQSRQLNIVDTFSASVGRHDVKAGLDYRHLEASSQGPVGHIVIVNSFEQLRAGTMGTVATLAAEGIAVATHNWSTFVQDAWRVSDTVTMTYGIRWEANTTPVSTTPGKPLRVIQGIFDDGPIRVAPAGTPLWQTRYGNIAPRVGATWSLTPATVLRGGAGLVHDLGYGGMLGHLIQGFPYNRFRTTAAVGQPYDLQSPVFDTPPQPTIPGAGTRGTLVSFDPDLTLPRTWQWHAAIERQFGDAHALSLTYVGARGEGLLRPDFVSEVLAPGAPGVAVMASRNAGRSRYDALQAVIRRRMSHGLQALGSYTLSNARDTESDDIGGNFNGAAWNAETASTLARLPTPSLAPADFDARHAWSAALSYALPSPRWGYLARAVLSGWSIDAIARGSSARPINVRIQGVSPVLGTYATQPDLVAGQPIWIAAPAEPAGKVLNPDAFTLPAEGAVGSLARNSIDSPFGINQTDLALRRRFTFAGDVSLEFRAEAFNVFNHPMFGGASSPVGQWGRCTTRPCTGQQSPGFGKVASLTLNEGLGGDPLSGGQADIYAVGGARSMQLSLKLRF